MLQAGFPGQLALLPYTDASEGYDALYTDTEVYEHSAGSSFAYGTYGGTAASTTRFDSEGIRMGEFVGPFYVRPSGTGADINLYTGDWLQMSYPAPFTLTKLTFGTVFNSYGIGRPLIFRVYGAETDNGADTVWALV